MTPAYTQAAVLAPTGVHREFIECLLIPFDDLSPWLEGEPLNDANKTVLYRYISNFSRKKIDMMKYMVILYKMKALKLIVYFGVSKR